MTGAEWARQEHLAMLGLSVQSRNATESSEQALADAREVEPTK